jgi:hypothetical protein
MVMRSGLGVGMDVHRAGPQLAGPDAREIDRRLALHAGRLSGVRVELAGGHDAHTVVLPGVCGAVPPGLVAHGDLLVKTVRTPSLCRADDRKPWVGSAIGLK